MLMGLVKRLARPFFSVERRSRIGQLRDDFGDFPPTPLCCDGISGEFEVVRTRGIGEVWHTLIVQKRMLWGLEPEGQDLSTDVMEYFGAEELRDLRTALNGFGHTARFIKPAAVALMLGVMGVRLTFNMLRSTGQESKGLGCFIPVRRLESEIVVKAGLHARLRRSEEPTISHEHIHLLQYDDSEDRLRHARLPERLLSEKGSSEPFLLYLLQANEVEARLHESVLSFYRVYRRLPVTLPMFLGMLVASEQFGEFIGLTLEGGRVTFDRLEAPYPERGGAYAEQLEFLLLYIDTQELVCRFVTEVMTVMYGNLLRYYGDENASGLFLLDIARPNLYDDLYAKQGSS